jgi:transcription termination factor Rho
MSVLDRDALEQSPLADLHAIASELSIDSYRLLRREHLIEAILSRQEGGDGQPAAAGEAEPKPRRRRGRRGGGGRAATTDETPAIAPAAVKDEPSEPGVAPASDRTRFEGLRSRFPDEPFRFASEDPILAAIESLTPIGKGSRVTIVGPPRAGKSELLRRLTGALAGRDDVQLLLVLIGVRPEEIAEWESGPVEPVEALSLVAPASAQDRAVYAAIDKARSIAVGGNHAVVLLDTLDGLHEHAARRALATARRLVEGGSVTVVATASEPFGGETTVIKLDALGTEVERMPALDLLSSGTWRAELLVGEEGAAAIARARAEAASQLAG